MDEEVPVSIQVKEPMRLVLLLAALAISAHAATVTLSNGQSCTYISGTLDSAGNASYICSGAPQPTPPVPAPTPPPAPPPAPTPVPTSGVCINSAGESIPIPTNIVMQTMKVGGTNNYALDGTWSSTAPQNTIQVFPLPTVWGDGKALRGANVQFTSTSFVNLSAEYEVSFSKCPGDFSYYKNARASVPYGTHTFFPCGIRFGSDFNISWGNEGPSIYACYTPPGEQWYMNWRVHNCPTDKGRTCGQTFYVPRG